MREIACAQRGWARSGLWLAWLSVGGLAAGAAAEVETLKVRVHRAIPHDTSAFTQGLLWWDGRLYESTGLRGASSLRRLHPETGEVELRAALPVFFFGEGLARVDERLVMLTWKAGQAFVFGLENFEPLGRKRYRGEGWGLCHDGARFVMSDGSAYLTFRDSDSFAVLGTVAVQQDGRPQPQLNELECVGDAVYANVFGSDVILRIDAESGAVTARIDAAGLLDAEAAASANVLNGIAYDPAAERFYVTGKLWPWLFEATFE